VSKASSAGAEGTSRVGDAANSATSAAGAGASGVRDGANGDSTSSEDSAAATQGAVAGIFAFGLAAALL
jgi:hypothetical protein